jgi:[protein-PII] uridylyltransferase
MARRSIFAELHEVGLMTAMVPEFEPLLGRVQHDVYHVYTVDVHSVRAVDRLHALVRGDLRQSLPRASRLAAEAPRKEPLFLALLLHDIGKARGKDHSTTGAEMARPIAVRLGLSAVDVEHVVWLVKEHLSLYKWATRRDTSDPETVAEIAEAVSGFATCIS